MNALHTICYLSKGDKELKDFDLENLYTKLKAKNHLSKITGILINDNGYFFQVLEGETKKLKKLYSLISLDERHSNVIKI
ncbi:MAG: BLUF domain-containing protein, partial [Bacteroidota bacterium]